MTDFDLEDTPCQMRALYFLGTLDPAAEAEFERHLAQCAECLDDGEQLGPILGGMAMLSGEEIGTLVHEHGADMAVDRATIDDQAIPAGDGGLLVGDRLDGDRRPQRPGGSVAAEAQRESRPPAHPSRRRPRRRRVLVGALAAIMILAVGVVFGVNLLFSGRTTIATGDAVLATQVVAQGSQAAARLSVAVADNHGRVTIRATVVGLQAGTRYRLYAATSDGRTQVVSEWAGRPEAHEVVGEMSATVDELAFFTVTHIDDEVIDEKVVVTARVVRSQSTSPTH